MEPTRAEMSTMTTVDAIADWADLPHRVEDAEEATSPRGTFYAALGATATTPPRVIAAIPDDVYKSTVDEWRISGARPSPVLRASAGLVGSVARLVCGAVPTAEAKAAERAKAEELEKLKAQAAIAVTTAPKGRCIKLSTIVDQANDLEIEPLAVADVEAAYAAYRAKMGDTPRPEEDLTPEQLGGLKALFASGAPPYVDLAVWGPFGRRIQKKLKLTGLVMTSGGTLQQAQLFGPPSVEEWQAGFAIFRTGAIMLEEISPATLGLWVKVITGYAARYGPEVWALVYQTDVRARLEHMERVRRIGASARAQAVDAGGTHAFNPNHPWEWVFRQTAEDSQFWRRELEEPALLIKTRVDKLSSSIDDDAPLGRSHRPMSSRPAAVADVPPRKKQKSGPVKERLDRVHITDADGYFTHNRRGIPLCSAFQKGECASSSAGGGCPKDSGRAHQCSKCLFLGHGKHQCSATEVRRDNTGKGKGKGKSKGKYDHRAQN